jgi:glycerophosphoryl diester phosphodiesterase
VQAIDPQIRIALLAEKNRDLLIETAWKMGAYAVNPRFDMVDAAFCDKTHARGLQVLVWTVDAPELMRALISAGVDGIMTNHPAQLREVVAGR